MSRPQNPLNLFRSYAYHHILVVCDGTETAEKLATQSEMTLFDHERAEKRFCAQSLVDGTGSYVVLINGLSDTQFTVKSAKWASVLIPNEKVNEGTTHFRTMAVDGELTIHEPLGVNFLNLLNEVTKILGTDPNGVVFLLKTIFVGHRDDDTTEMITNIRPLLFLTYDITALIEVTGAEYVLAFVGVVNGASRIPHVAAVSNGFTYTIKTEASIENTLKDLFVKINAYYVRERKKLTAIASCSDTNYDYKEEFFDVSYSVEVDEGYKNFTAGTATPANKQTEGDNDAIITMAGDSISIEGLIDLVMKSSQQVLDEDQKKDDEKFMYKITSTLKTGPEKFNVEYEVQRYKATVVPVEKFLSFTPLAADGKTKLGIEFDYIFTGQNIDIKTFDIKMQYAMTFFQTLAVSPSIPTSAHSIIAHYNPQPIASGTGNKEASGDQQEQGGCKPKKRRKPLFLGMTVNDTSVRNTRNPGPAANYNSLLARHAAFENIEARAVIHGNPQLLEETTQLPSDLNPTLDINNPITSIIRVPGDAQLDDDHRNRDLMPFVHRVPGYVKINVFMPNSAMVNDSSSVYNNDFAQNFWYPGWYFLYSINHVFDNGEFTQELEMFSLPTDASQSKLSKEEKDCIKKKTGTGQGTDTGTPADVGLSEADKKTIAETESRLGAATRQSWDELLGGS